MSSFFPLEFNYCLLCPVNKTVEEVCFQAYPYTRGHVLDVVSCSAVADVAKLTCGKTCRTLLEVGQYWQRIHAIAPDHDGRQ